MNLHWFRDEAQFDPLLLAYRVEADRIMLAMCVFLQLVCTIAAAVNGAWTALAVVGLPTLALVAAMVRWQPGTLATRLAMACAFMLYAALRIQQSGGETEAHFAVVALIGVLLYYRDWRTIFAATGFIYLHHVLLGFLQMRGLPFVVFDQPAQYLVKLTVHVLYFLPFIGMMSYLAIMLRREGVASRSVIEWARQIVQGDITATTHGQHPSTAREGELVEAVLAMRNRILELLHVMPVSVAVIRDDTGCIADVNHAFTRLFGITRDECLGRPVEALPIWQDPGFWQARGRQLRRTTDRTDRYEAAMYTAGGRALTCELAALQHDSGKPHMTILAFDDVTLRREAERRLRHLAHNDPLTGLPNRASLQTFLDEAAALRQRDGTPYAVAMLDLDGFKAINDYHGHQAGDAVLVEVAHRLTAVARGSDRVCRLGGDEFVLVMAGCGDDDAARTIGQRTLDAIGQPLALPMFDGRPARVGASIGITHATTADQSDPVAPLRRADQAMYRAKSAGKNQVVIYDRRAVKRAPTRDFMLGSGAAS